MVKSFYGKLQQTINATPKTDCLYLIGDFNAKAGQQPIDKRVMRNHGLGVINERGHRLIEFCRENELVIANTRFKHFNRRKYTWISPDRHTRNQTDYRIIQQRWKSNILSCRTYPGADCHMNHQLLIGKIGLKVQNKPRLNLPHCFNIDEIPQVYHVQIENKFEILAQMQKTTEPENLWQKTKEILLNIEKTCDYTEKKKTKE